MERTGDHKRKHCKLNNCTPLYNALYTLYSVHLIYVLHTTQCTHNTIYSAYYHTLHTSCNCGKKSNLWNRFKQEMMHFLGTPCTDSKQCWYDEIRQSPAYTILYTEDPKHCCATSDGGLSRVGVAALGWDGADIIEKLIVSNCLLTQCRIR